MPRGSELGASRRGRRCCGRAFARGLAAAPGLAAVLDFDAAFGRDPDFFGWDLRALGDPFAAARAEARRLPATVDAR